MSQDKKYQVFISSTFTDLINAREKATKVILDLYHLPVGMEMFSADDDDQWKIITDAIDVSDYYVLIIGHRYGSLTSKGISYTEKEFNYAKSKKIPIISFIRDRNAPVSNDDRETVQESLIKLDKFIEKAKNGKMCAFWTDVSDLERQIAVALPKSFARHKGVGWVRGDTKSEHVAEEIAKLSEENRKLREENSRLNELSKTKTPLLTLVVNEKESIDTIVLNDYELKENEYYQRPEKKELDFDGRTMWGADTYEGRVTRHNEKIDAITQEEIDQHNKAIKQIQKLQHECFNLKLNITNEGNTIANMINIEMEIPDNIMLIDNKSKHNIKYFRDESSKNLIGDITFRLLANQYSINKTCQFYNDILIALPVSSSLDSDVRIIFLHKIKKLRIEKEKLLHSRSLSLDNLYLYPKSIGEGTIKINLICAELSEPIVYEIPVKVE
jgi:hypothetical protein